MDAIRTPLTTAECQALKVALEGWRHRNVSWLINTHGDIDHVLLCLRQLSDGGHIVKFYRDDIFQGILAFDVGHTWWTPHLICSELFILAADGAVGFQREAAQQLDILARDYGARLIVAGNIFQENNALIGNGYKKCGFRQECSTYVKEITT